MCADRNLAIAYGAVSLSKLLTQAGLANVLAQLTARQVLQLQGYLDASVVDPVIKKEVAELSVRGSSSKREVERVMRDYITVGRLDDSALLDLGRLLDRKALAPISDNPDESKYLKRVRAKLEDDGVWLRLSPKPVRDPQDPSRWIYDGRNFEAWLSLGSRGGQIPAKNGVIDRDALLSTQVIGANYWRLVDKGPVVSAVDRQANYLSSEIDNALALHREMLAVRAKAAPGVVPISDLLGGADFPNISLWQPVIKLLGDARRERNEGRIWGARCLLMLTGVYVRNLTRTLTKYMDDTSAGAKYGAWAVRIIAVVGVIVATLLTGGAAAPALAGEAAGETAIENEVGVEMAEYIEENGGFAENVPQPNAMMRGVPQRGMNAPQRGFGVGFQSYP